MAKKEEKSLALPVTQKQLVPITEAVDTLTISSPADMTAATDMLSQINKHLDATIDYKEVKTKPLNALLKTIRAETKPLESALEALRDTVRSKMSQYQTEAKRRADAEAERIAARIKPGRGNLSAETGVQKIAELDTPAKDIQADSGSVQFRTVHKLVISDSVAVMLWAVKNNAWALLSINESTLKQVLISGKLVTGAHLEAEQVPYNSR